MQAMKLNARIGPNAELHWQPPAPDLPEGEVGVTLVYNGSKASGRNRPSPKEWPVLKGGRFRGGKLSREEIYDE